MKKIQLPVPLLAALAFQLSPIAYADDWPQWRGAARDGICKEKNLLAEWPADGPELAWKT